MHIQYLTKLRIWQHVRFAVKVIAEDALSYLTNELWHVQKLRKSWQHIILKWRCSTSSRPASGFYYNIFWRLKRFLLTVNEPTIIETYKLCYIMSCQQKSVVISSHNNIHEQELKNLDTHVTTIIRSEP